MSLFWKNKKIERAYRATIAIKHHALKNAQNVLNEVEAVNLIEVLKEVKKIICRYGKQEQVYFKDAPIVEENIKSNLEKIYMVVKTLEDLLKTMLPQNCGCERPDTIYDSISDILDYLKLIGPSLQPDFNTEVIDKQMKLTTCNKCGEIDYVHIHTCPDSWKIIIDDIEESLYIQAGNAGDAAIKAITIFEEECEEHPTYPVANGKSICVTCINRSHDTNEEVKYMVAGKFIIDKSGNYKPTYLSMRV